MGQDTFWYILYNIRPHIEKQSNVRKYISAEERLAVTLRHYTTHWHTRSEKKNDLVLTVSRRNMSVHVSATRRNWDRLHLLKRICLFCRCRPCMYVSVNYRPNTDAVWPQPSATVGPQNHLAHRNVGKLTRNPIEHSARRNGLKKVAQIFMAWADWRSLCQQAIQQNWQLPSAGSTQAKFRAN